MAPHSPTATRTLATILALSTMRRFIIAVTTLTVVAICNTTIHTKEMLHSTNQNIWVMLVCALKDMAKKITLFYNHQTVWPPPLVLVRRPQISASSVTKTTAAWRQVSLIPISTVTNWSDSKNRKVEFFEH